MRLEWNRVGSRGFETGIDRGVLYPQGATTGVPWNGLVSFNETPTGGEPEAFYLDGHKFANRSTREEFAGSISAYTYPNEFAACDGTAYLGRGLYLPQQRRKDFGLCYRTKIGNDTQGEQRGYKLHILYNLLAAPSTRDYQTISDSPEAITFDWSLTSRPVRIAGYRSSSQLVIDSTQVTAELLASLEDILYGTSSADPRLPLPTEVVALFSEWPELYIHDNGDGTFTASGPDNIVAAIDNRTFQITSTTAVDNGNGTFDVTSY